MELTLNLIWMALSATTLVVLVRRAPHARVAATIAICLAAIAFPIISISDDLCNDVLLADALTIRRTVHRAHLRPFAVAADVIVAKIALIEVSCCGIVTVAPLIAPPGCTRIVIAVRGPPLRVC
jgi:hypothetical protein